MPKKKPPEERKSLPADERAEQAVIGAVLLEPKTLDQLDVLSWDDFAVWEYGIIYRTLCQMWQADQEINEHSVYQELAKLESTLPTAIPASYLSNALAETPSAANAVQDATTVAEIAVKRRLFAAAELISKTAMESASALDALDKARALIDMISWQPSKSRFVIFRNGVELAGENPNYQFTIIRPSDRLSCIIRVKSADLDDRRVLRRIIRENMHLNPRLPDSKSWENFIHHLVNQASVLDAPEALRKDAEVSYWVQEWFKAASPVDVAQDLATGYVLRNNFYYFQPNRLHKWLAEHAKVKPSLSELWAILSSHGATREIAIKIKGETRRLWGLPAKFVEEGKEEQLPLGETAAAAPVETSEDVMSFLEEDEDDEEG